MNISQELQHGGVLKNGGIPKTIGFTSKKVKLWMIWGYHQFIDVHYIIIYLSHENQTIWIWLKNQCLPNCRPGHLQGVPQDGSQMVFFKHRRSLNWFSSYSLNGALDLIHGTFRRSSPPFSHTHTHGLAAGVSSPFFLRPKVTSQFLVKSIKVYEISQQTPLKIPMKSH